MGQAELYPLTFVPVLKDYVWGGRNLETMLGRELPAGKAIAESWEISAHPNGDVTAANGPLQGTSLAALFADYGEALVGRHAATSSNREHFPLLVKLLDAHRKLSVQVHPDDDYAREHEGHGIGKSEMWVVLYAEPGAAIIFGVKPGTTRPAFRQAIENGTLEDWLHYLPVKAGDFVCVPAGSLHAILGGSLIAEIQQNSDTTYRVYDWNRTDEAGNSRPLHVDQALDVIHFDQVSPELPAAQALGTEGGIARWELCRTPYFVVERVQMKAGTTWRGDSDGGSLEIWGTISGSATTRGGGEMVDLPAVRFALVPASVAEFTVTAVRDSLLLRTFIPAPS